MSALSPSGDSSEVVRLLALLRDAQEERDLLRTELDALQHLPLPSPAPSSFGLSLAAAGSAASSASTSFSNLAALPPSAHLPSGAPSGGSAPPSSHNLRLAEELVMRQKFVELAGESGSIGAEQLLALQRKLGEPLSEAEAREAVATLGDAGARLSFPAFVAYWWGCHAAAPRAYGETGLDAEALAQEREVKRQRYFRRFQLKRRTLAARLDRVSRQETGAPNTLEWRLHFYTDVAGERTEISPWHDIPLMNEDGTLNMVVEIPRWTRRKLEIATQEEFNPIKLDSKNGLVRIIGYGDQLFNYGAFPQTWESPCLKTLDPATGTVTPGDNDPIDVVEIGARQHPCGSIIKVKVLGVLGLIDDGETDWKVFAIAVDDPLASRIHTLEDMKREMPGALEAERDYLRYYKEKKENNFMFNGEVQDEVFAKRMIAETHEAWKKLVMGQVVWDEACSPDAAEGGGGAVQPSIVAAGLMRSRGSAGALAAMVGAPPNASNVLLGGEHEVEEVEAGAQGLTI